MEYMAKHARAEDVAEIEACGHRVGDALMYGFRKSVHPWTILRGDRPVAIGGAIQSPLYEDCAIIWLVATDEIDRYPVAIYRAIKYLIDKTLERFKCLANYIDARNKGAVEMLRRLGFTIDEPMAHGPMGLPFHRFYKVVSDV